MSIDRFKAWMAASTTCEKLAVVEVADTSLQVLYQVASAHRKASPELAGRIVKGIAVVAKKKRKEALPIVLRGDISEVCSGCEYYKGACK